MSLAPLISIDANEYDNDSSYMHDNTFCGQWRRAHGNNTEIGKKHRDEYEHLKCCENKKYLLFRFYRLPALLIIIHTLIFVNPIIFTFLPPEHRLY